ncbi:MAG: LysM peptidoglycan-binding domain-containing protein [Brevinematia bacterium]
MFIPVLIFTFLAFGHIFSLEYKVKEGDTLWNISKRFNIDGELIEKINEIVVLKSGQDILIPDKLIKYRVESGDSLSSISKKFSSSIKYIIILNNLKSEEIYNGQLLQIPVFEKYNTISSKTEKEKDVIIHTVKKGETLFSISKNYNVSIKDIIYWNNKYSHNIFPEEKLKIYCNKDNLKLEKNTTKSWYFPLRDKTLITGYSEGKRGLTFFLSKCSEIYNIKDGVVEYTGHINGYDKVVIVRSENYKIVYGYLNEVYVKKGDNIKTGVLIANTDYHNFIGRIAFYLEIRNGKKIEKIDKIFSLDRDKLFAKK